MASLTLEAKPRRRLGLRDFSTSSYRAPVVVRRLSRAYNQPQPSAWHAWRWLAPVVILLALAGFITYAPLFQIRNLIINNVPSQTAQARLHAIVSEVMVTKSAWVFPQSNLIFFNSALARAKIANEFYTEGLTFDRHWPNVLRLTMPNESAALRWRVGEQSLLVDRRGVLVQRLLPDDEAANRLVEVRETDSTTQTLGQQALDLETTTFLTNLQAAWEYELPQLKLTYVEYNQSALPSLKLFTQNGWYVYASTHSPVNLQITALKRLLEEKIRQAEPQLEYIDVRFGSKLYYRLK